MNISKHYLLLIVGTTIYLLGIFTMPGFQYEPISKPSLADTNAQILVQTIINSNAIIHQTNLFAMSERIFSLYLGFVILVFGHFKFSAKQKNNAA